MSSKHPFDTHQQQHRVGAEPDDAPRAAKRRRVGMPTADGFILSTTTTNQNPNQKPKLAHKPPVPRFVSAFVDSNDNESENGNDKYRNGNVSLDGKTKIDALNLKVQGRAVSVSKLPVPGLGIAGPSTSRSDRLPVDDASIGLGPKLVMSKFKDRDREKKRISSAPNLSMKFALNPNATTKPKSNTTTTTRLRPAAVPRAIAAASSSTTTTIPNPNLKQIIPPALAFPVPKAPSKPLQPVQPPVLPIPPPKNKKELRALSSTGLGLLNDLSSEHVAEGLAGILLRDQHPEISAMQAGGGGVEMRGLEMSPEKEKMGRGKSGGESKSKYARFVRGGLAARAAAHFERTSTAHLLWKKDVERSGGANTFPPPVFCARIIKILHTPTHTSRPPSYSPGIALCRIRQANGTPHAAYKPDRLYRIIFASLAASPNTDDDEGFRAQFAEGRTISIFKPWQELCTSPDGPSSSPDVPRRPARLPMLMCTPIPTPDPLAAPIHPTALVCTRFHIQPQP